MPITLIKDRDDTNPFDHISATIRTDAEYLPDVLEAVETFLRAAGYVFDGYIDVVNKEPEGRGQAFEEEDDDFPEADQPFPSEVEELKRCRCRDKNDDDYNGPCTVA